MSLEVANDTLLFFSSQSTFIPSLYCTSKLYLVVQVRVAFDYAARRISRCPKDPERLERDLLAHRSVFNLATKATS